MLAGYDKDVLHAVKTCVKERVDCTGEQERSRSVYNRERNDVRQTVGLDP